MSIALQLRPISSSFALKTFTFSRGVPATIELDGYADDTPFPAPNNAIFPSVALAIDQAYIDFTGTSFKLRSFDELSSNVRVNGRLLRDCVHKIQDDDVLEFGRYRRLESHFTVECSARVSLSQLPSEAPSTTNWAGVHKLVDEIRRAGVLDSEHQLASSIGTTDRFATCPDPTRVAHCAAPRPSGTSVPTSVLASSDTSTSSIVAPSATPLNASENARKSDVVPAHLTLPDSVSPPATSDTSVRPSSSSLFQASQSGSDADKEPPFQVRDRQHTVSSPDSSTKETDDAGPAPSPSNAHPETTRADTKAVAARISHPMPISVSTSGLEAVEGITPAGHGRALSQAHETQALKTNTFPDAVESVQTSMPSSLTTAASTATDTFSPVPQPFRPEPDSTVCGNLIIQRFSQTATDPARMNSNATKPPWPPSSSFRSPRIVGQPETSTKPEIAQAPEVAEESGTESISPPGAAMITRSDDITPHTDTVSLSSAELATGRMRSAWEEARRLVSSINVEYDSVTVSLQRVRDAWFEARSLVVAATLPSREPTTSASAPPLASVSGQSSPPEGSSRLAPASLRSTTPSYNELHCRASIVRSSTVPAVPFQSAPAYFLAPLHAFHHVLNTIAFQIINSSLAYTNNNHQLRLPTPFLAPLCSALFPIPFH